MQTNNHKPGSHSLRSLLVLCRSIALHLVSQQSLGEHNSRLIWNLSLNQLGQQR